MRLTLRTLLAYLDDTLEPTEIKQIGQKVAESDAAQELIARIKQVTRKRRLTTPPLTGPGAKFDPNLIAEYLDNELSGEQVAEIEKICLESDVHLAEIAASHQILTLVLGEPALVPPTARERMYGLVKGREAIPFRKAAAKNPNAVGKGDGEGDETAVLGVPVHKRHASWLKWAIPVAGLFLFVALAAALYSVLRDTRPPQQVAGTDKANPNAQDIKNDPVAVKEKADKVKADKEKADKEKADKEQADKEQADKEKPDKEKADKEKADKEKADNGKSEVTWPTDRPKEPSKDRKEIATYEGSPPRASILVGHQRDADTWTRIKPNGRVSTSDALVSLPGYTSELRADSGVKLVLWGTLPEFNQGNQFCPYLFESAVTLHDNPKTDLEFTLDRGRVYLSNHKPDNKPALVRVRFGKEVWDVILQEPDTEIALELVARYTDRINYLDGEEPLRDLTLLVTKGAAALKYDDYHELADLRGPLGPAFVIWNNKGPGVVGPIKVEKDAPLIALLGKEPFTPQSTKAVATFRPALDEVSGMLSADKKSVELMLLEGVKTGTMPDRKALCIYCLGAIDAVPALFNILGNEAEAAGREREAAVVALRRWICRGPADGQIPLRCQDQRGPAQRKELQSSRGGVAAPDAVLATQLGERWTQGHLSDAGWLSGAQQDAHPRIGVLSPQAVDVRHQGNTGVRSVVESEDARPSGQ